MSTALAEVVVSAPGRAAYVRQRLVALSRNAAEMVVEASILLREVKNNSYWVEWGAKSFDEAILALQNEGKLDFGPRQARYLLQIADMFEKAHIAPEQVGELGISKLREIASLPTVDQQREMLEAAQTMSTAEVQAAAKKVRDKHYGRDADPLHPITIMTSQTQRDMFTTCITLARKIYAVPEGAPDVAVLIDFILADWRGSAIEAEQAGMHETDLAE